MNYDTLVVGSGAGGATLAACLAERGERVLLIERGQLGASPVAHQDEARMMQGEGSYDIPLIMRGRRTVPLLGSVLGGSTALYGSVLMRPSPSDLTPGAYYARYLDPCLWEWPVSYDEWEPYFEEAEDLFRVAGDATAEIPHFRPRTRPYLQPPMPLTSFNERLRSRLQASGTHAFTLPLAIDLAQCRQCSRCPGFFCPHDARSSSWNRSARPLWESGRLEVLTGHSVERLVTKDSKVKHVVVTSREGLERNVYADKVVLAAGALGTARLLLQSDIQDRSQLIGRNYMYHLGVACISLVQAHELDNRRFQKQLGLTDYYLGTPDFPHKLGLAQSIPTPGPLTLQSRLPFRAPLGLMLSLQKRLHTFVIMVEDLPQPQNRVKLTREGLGIEHSFHPYDHFRAQGARALLTQLFRQAGLKRSFGYIAGFERKHLGHQVGTCRMGLDPRKSVVDPLGRLHAYDNLFVADGSWLPTSLGVGPALMIAAQALRLADALKPESSLTRREGEKNDWFIQKSGAHHWNSRDSWSGVRASLCSTRLGGLGSEPPSRSAGA